jgi:hypothetical protein
MSERGNQTATPPVAIANPNMLRMIAMQIDNAIVNAKEIPDYLREAGSNFTAAMKKFVEELEAKEEHGNAAKSVGK